MAFRTKKKLQTKKRSRKSKKYNRKSKKQYGSGTHFRQLPNFDSAECQRPISPEDFQTIQQSIQQCMTNKTTCDYVVECDIHDKYAVEKCLLKNFNISLQGDSSMSGLFSRMTTMQNTSYSFYGRGCKTDQSYSIRLSSPTLRKPEIQKEYPEVKFNDVDMNDYLEECQKLIQLSADGHCPTIYWCGFLVSSKTGQYLCCIVMDNQNSVSLSSYIEKQLSGTGEEMIHEFLLKLRVLAYKIAKMTSCITYRFFSNIVIQNNTPKIVELDPFYTDKIDVALMFDKPDTDAEFDKDRNIGALADYKYLRQEKIVIATNIMCGLLFCHLLSSYISPEHLRNFISNINTAENLQSITPNTNITQFQQFSPLEKYICFHFADIFITPIVTRYVRYLTTQWTRQNGFKQKYSGHDADENMYITPFITLFFDFYFQQSSQPVKTRIYYEMKLSIKNDIVKLVTIANDPTQIDKIIMKLHYILMICKQIYTKMEQDKKATLSSSSSSSSLSLSDDMGLLFSAEINQLNPLNFLVFNPNNINIERVYNMVRIPRGDGSLQPVTKATTVQQQTGQYLMFRDLEKVNKLSPDYLDYSIEPEPSISSMSRSASFVSSISSLS